MTIFILIFSAFIIYFLQEKLYTKYWNYNLDVNVAFQPSPVIEGETGALTETITNAKILPLTVLDVKFSFSKYIIFINGEHSSVSDLCYKHDVFSLLFYQKITRTLSFRCLKRGYYEIDKINLVSHDLLLSKTFVYNQKQYTNLYVYPKPVDSSKINIPFQKIMGEFTSKRFLFEDPFEFSGIRDYQVWDPLNKINWSASARSMNLMVNTHNSTTSQTVTILLNLENEGVLNYEGLKEEAIRIAASLCEKLIYEGIPIRLVTNGCDCLTKSSITIPSGNGHPQLQLILENLSRINLLLPMESFTSLIEMEKKESYYSNIYYVLISTSQKKTLVDSFSSLLQSSSSGYWIVPRYSDFPQKIQSNNKYNLLSWEVEKDEC